MYFSLPNTMLLCVNLLQVLSKLEVIRSDAIKQCKEEASIQVRITLTLFGLSVTRIDNLQNAKAVQNLIYLKISIWAPRLLAENMTNSSVIILIYCCNAVLQ